MLSNKPSPADTLTGTMSHAKMTRPYFTLNHRLSTKAGINLYINEFQSNRNGRFVENAVFCEYFDLHAQRTLCSAGHNHFNESMLQGRDKTHAEDKPKKYVPNEYGTTRTVLFYAVFSALPNETSFETEYPVGVCEEELNSIVNAVKDVLNRYPNAPVKVVSNVFRFYSAAALESDAFFSRVRSIGSSRVQIDAAYDMERLSPSEALVVVTNKSSFLFAHTVRKRVPIALTDLRGLPDDTYIKHYFNDLYAPQLHVIEDTLEFDDFLCTQHDSSDSRWVATCDIHRRIMSDYMYLSGAFFTEASPDLAGITKVCMYDKACIYGRHFRTDANRELVTFASEVRDPAALVITVLHHRFERNVREQARWLGLDGDNFARKNEPPRCLRYYHKSYNNVRSMYRFDSVDEVCRTFRLDPVRAMAPDREGIVLVLMDNPFGRTYASVDEWVRAWTEVFDRLVALGLSNPIVLRPYDIGDVAAIDEAYHDHFAAFKDRLTYDPSLRNADILDVTLNRAIYFCVKRNGPYFGKCFLRGRLLLSALTPDEAATKPDHALILQYEHNLRELSIDNARERISEFARYYVDNQLRVLTIITSYLVAIDDVENGRFLRFVLNKQ